MHENTNFYIVLNYSVTGVSLYKKKIKFIAKSDNYNTICNLLLL